MSGSSPFARPGLRRAWLAALAVAGSAALAACSTAPSAGSVAAGSSAAASSAAGSVIPVVAAENVWGSLAAQLGGDRVTVTDIIDNPDADPHDYEPTAQDARAMAGARLVIDNGIGYDAWAGKLIAANPVPGRTVLTVGDLVGVPAGGNPHRWYSPGDVRTVIDRITADYKSLDPASAAAFDALHDTVVSTDLQEYFDLVAQIRSRYAGTPIGASESIVTPLAEATGLALLTPPSFLAAISAGSDPTAADKAAIDAQITGKKIKVYVYNSQNATPDVQRQVEAAKAAGIPLVTVTETLTPAGASFQVWQVRQLTALAAALATATGR
ncbi:MAG TPA: zinc ABC transporter substrate-binding protein [Kineosporiaceae bacterium]|nr:zinc ABC transporter substrate-binding protein [Kineosporiaceae bacterium]